MMKKKLLIYFFAWAFSLAFLLLYSLPSLAEGDGAPEYASWICDLSERISYILPSSPITLEEINLEFSEVLPQLGGGIATIILHDVSAVLACVIPYKIIVILPGKM